MFRISQVPLLGFKPFKKYLIDAREEVACFDLGSAISRVAILDKNNHAKILFRSLPTSVAFTEYGKRLIGVHALNQAGLNIQNTIYGLRLITDADKRLFYTLFRFVRLIRFSFNFHTYSPFIFSECFPFKIVKSSNNDPLVESYGKRYSTAQLYSYIIEEMKKMSTDLSNKVTGAVVTVPAYFNESQRQSIRDAFKLANLYVIGFIDEPVAAALAYGLNISDNKRIAVYNLEGGTFDISILEIKDGKFVVKSTIADSFLGAENFDNALVYYQCMRDLSDGINLPAACLNRTVEICNKAMSKADCEPSDIDLVLVTGGMALLPEVQELVYNIFEKPPCISVNPLEAILMGACVRANELCAIIWLGASYVVRMFYVGMGVNIDSHKALTNLCYFAASFLRENYRLVKTPFDLAQSCHALHYRHGAGLSKDIMEQFILDVMDFVEEFSKIDKRVVEAKIKPYLDGTADTKKNDYLKDVRFAEYPVGDYIGATRYHFTYSAY
uniref:Heat shock 70 kDa protein 14 n=1 Tax=Meloidogyne hapla TaxID=6305 RepID=A0A1I8B1G1_MELHA